MYKVNFGDVSCCLIISFRAPTCSCPSVLSPSLGHPLFFGTLTVVQPDSGSLRELMNSKWAKGNSEIIGTVYK